MKVCGLTAVYKESFICIYTSQCNMAAKNVKRFGTK
jgi:hypothetical protein